MQLNIDPRTTLALQLPKAGVGAEIGVLNGEFSNALLTHTRPTLLHLIDPWAVTSTQGYGDALYSQQNTTQAAMDRMHDAVRARFAPQITAGQIRVHRARSDQALAQMPDDSLDWLYLDGDHTRSAVAADLALAARKIKPGGLIAGDDYGLGGWWDGGVLKAVHEFLHAQQARFVVAFVLGNQFALRRAG